MVGGNFGFVVIILGVCGFSILVIVVCIVVVLGFEFFDVGFGLLAIFRVFQFRMFVCLVLGCVLNSELLGLVWVR